MEENKKLIYVPRYVKQITDYNYGEVLSHEAYNDMMNRNSDQGDYNTEVLNTLFNSESKEYRIKYLDNELDSINNTIEEVRTDCINESNAIKENIIDIESNIDDLELKVTDAHKNISDIIDGTTAVCEALVANDLKGLVSSGPNKYYGTDAEANTGFFDVPETIYVEDLDTIIDTSGIVITPASGSVTEAMLDEALATKVNRVDGVTDYDYLTSRPSINGVLLTGDISVEDLGLQEAGDFVTNTSLNHVLEDYYTAETTDAVIESSVNTGIGNLPNRVSALETSVSKLPSSIPQIQVGSTFTGTPKIGDMLITL